MGSFSFDVARAMLKNGFPPDTISSDIHQLCINGPAFDQITTLSKFLCLGMPLIDVIRAPTANAGHALRRPDLGTLKPGVPGDAAILSIDDGDFEYVDTTEQTLAGDKKINVHGVILGGKWWHPI